MYFNKQSDEMIENHKMTSKTAQIKEISYQNVSQANGRKVLGDIGNFVEDFNGRCNIPSLSLNGFRSSGDRLLFNPSLPVNKCQKEFNRQGKTSTFRNLSRIEEDAKYNAKDLVIVGQTRKVNADHISNLQDGIRKVRAPMQTTDLTGQSEVDFYGGFVAEVSLANELLPDIDGGDLDNQLAVTEYVEDIYKFYKENERMSQVHNYMASQLEINAKMRAILVDWLIEVHLHFELMPETLYLTINLLDRYLSTESISKRNLQLLGLTAMLLASKYEEVSPVSLYDLVSISGSSCTKDKILAMEKTMLNKLKFRITVPTPYVFLVRFLKAADSDKEMENLVFFLTELSLVQYVMVKFTPSLLASAAVYTARCTLKKKHIWTNLLKHHTGYSEADLMDCVRLMVAIYHSNSAEKGSKSVRKKYSAPEFNSVALLCPAKLPVWT